jgi:endoglucanase
MSPASRRVRKARAPKLLLDLLAAHGPSGRESEATAVWIEAASAFGKAEVDAIGTPRVTVPARGRGPKRRLIVVGHIDEIGLIATHIDEKGFVWFAGVGGWDPQILVGQRVVFKTRRGQVRGVVGRKPIHLLRGEERKKVPELRELHVDIGARDVDDAKQMLRVGDVAVIDAAPLELPNGRLVSRALDNRLGSFVSLEAARIVAEAGGGQWEVVAIAAVQEETTFGGSETSAFSLAPDAAIVIDVTHATDAPNIDVRQEGSHDLGSGPVIARGSTLNEQLFEVIAAAGDAAKTPYTLEGHGRETGTDADAIHKSRGGVPTGLVSIPLRYMHSAAELVDVEDVTNSAKLVGAAALRLKRTTTLAP